MRVTTAFKRLMDLPGVTVTGVEFQPVKVVVTVKLRSAKLTCPECEFTTRAGYDARPVASTWRGLDLGRWRLEVRAGLRRLSCPRHGVRTQGVPFARPGAQFTRDFEDLVGWLATTMDKTALCRLVRIDWDTVGRIIERVMATGLDPTRLDRLFVAGVLAVAVCAVRAGARSFAAIGEWAVELSEDQLTRLGLEHAPVESTMRKLFARLDAVALDRQLAVLTWCRNRQVGGRRVIAMDGKTIRGARSATTTAPHLIAALDHNSGVVLGQNAVAAKSNEIPAVRDLLAGFDTADLHGCVITIDAMHTQDETAKTILDAGADYVFTVKANRPTLLAALKTLPWNKVPVGSTSTERGHGRRVTRTIKIIEVPELPGWPQFTGVAQVAQLRRTVTRAGKKSVEVVYLITSADYRAAPPATLAAWVQGRGYAETPPSHQKQ